MYSRDTASPPSSSHTITPSSPLSGSSPSPSASASPLPAQGEHAGEHSSYGAAYAGHPPAAAGMSAAGAASSALPGPGASSDGLAHRRGSAAALVGAPLDERELASAASGAAQPQGKHVRMAPLPSSGAGGANGAGGAQAAGAAAAGAGAGAAQAAGHAARPGTGRARSSSLVQVTKVEATAEQLLDQSAGFNANADWVNYKGAWVIHVVLILLAKILLDVIPGMHQDMSWTIVNVGYMGISYIMFHYVTGTPFDSNSGAYDDLTLWEQIDDGAQYTPAKKWLTSVPIGLFLISTHYTRYNPWLFSLNFFVTLFVLFPKLPILHRLRFKILPRSPYPSLPPTPTHSRPSTPAFARR